MKTDKKFDLKLLLHGIDTVQCAYYLEHRNIDGFDFFSLATQKEKLQKSKYKNPKPITLGSCGFLLQPYGSPSGYPIIIKNEDFRIECGRYNNPNFFVTFRSQALWRESAFELTHCIGWKKEPVVLAMDPEFSSLLQKRYLLPGS